MFSIAACRSETKYKGGLNCLPRTVQFDRYLIVNSFIQENVNPSKEKSCIFLKGNVRIKFLLFLKKQT